MDSRDVAEESYFVNILRLIGYTLNSLWDRFTRGIFKAFSKTKAADSFENVDCENCIDDNEVTKVVDVTNIYDANQICVNHEETRSLETSFSANIIIACENISSTNNL